MVIEVVGTAVTPHSAPAVPSIMAALKDNKLCIFLSHINSCRNGILSVAILYVGRYASRNYKEKIK